MNFSPDSWARDWNLPESPISHQGSLLSTRDQSSLYDRYRQVLSRAAKTMSKRDTELLESIKAISVTGSINAITNGDPENPKYRELANESWNFVRLLLYFIHCMWGIDINLELGKGIKWRPSLHLLLRRRESCLKSCCMPHLKRKENKLSYSVTVLLPPVISAHQSKIWGWWRIWTGATNWSVLASMGHVVSSTHCGLRRVKTGKSNEQRIKEESRHSDVIRSTCAI